eukprot:356469-Chlamydomonas_euryale.AAC.2
MQCDLRVKSFPTAPFLPRSDHPSPKYPKTTPLIKKEIRHSNVGTAYAMYLKIQKVRICTTLVMSASSHGRLSPQPVHSSPSPSLHEVIHPFACPRMHLHTHVPIHGLILFRMGCGHAANHVAHGIADLIPGVSAEQPRYRARRSWNSSPYWACPPPPPSSMPLMDWSHSTLGLILLRRLLRRSMPCLHSLYKLRLLLLSFPDLIISTLLRTSHNRCKDRHQPDPDPALSGQRIAHYSLASERASAIRGNHGKRLTSSRVRRHNTHTSTQGILWLWFLSLLLPLYNGLLAATKDVTLRTTNSAANTVLFASLAPSELVAGAYVVPDAAVTRHHRVHACRPRGVGELPCRAGRGGGGGEESVGCGCMLLPEGRGRAVLQGKEGARRGIGRVRVHATARGAWASSSARGWGAEQRDRSGAAV